MYFAQHFRRVAAAAVIALCFGAPLLHGQVLHGQELPKVPQAQVFPLTPTVGPFT
jgi:hypothetical protein